MHWPSKKGTPVDSIYTSQFSAEPAGAYLMKGKGGLTC